MSLFRPTPRRPSGSDRTRDLRFDELESRILLATVQATLETPNVSGAADDPAIWIHPTDPALSLILATDKTSGQGLLAYDLSGRQIDSASGNELNNVDLRYNFPISGESATLIAVSERGTNRIALFTIDPNSRSLSSVGQISTGMSIYGLCMYQQATTGDTYAFGTSKTGQVQQWELSDSGSGSVTGSLLRSFDVGGQVEGCVADDELEYLYVGEEADGVWKYGANPNNGSARTRVDSTGSSGHLTADVEGLAIYYANDGTGYLLVSSQGSNDFVIYTREASNQYVGTFKIVAGNGIDGVTDTDGIDVSNFPMNSTFGQGLFVAQDNDENFKVVNWESIATAFSPTLTIDTRWDPRLSGQDDPEPPVAEINGPYSGLEGNWIEFSSDGSYDSDGALSTYQWDFGDGNSSPLPNPSHRYLDDGEYHVTLTVTDDDGLTDSADALAMIANVAPTARVGGPYFGTEGTAIHFSGSASDPGSDELIFAWDFTYDGQTFAADRVGVDLDAVSFVYAAPGVFTVALRVSDDDSGTSEISTAVVNVSESSPNDHPWQNPVDPIDVDDDGEIIPLDALLIINHLNAHGSHALLVPVIPPDVPPPYLDVDGDNWVAPIDALQVINHLNGQLDGEGESYSGQRSTASVARPATMQWAGVPMAPIGVWLGWVPLELAYRARHSELKSWCDRVDRLLMDWPGGGNGDSSGQHPA